MTKIRIVTAEGEDGRVVLHMADDAGEPYRLDLSVFDVSTLVSMLYQAREDALHQETEQPPEVMLPIAGMTFGSDANYEILRIHVNAFLYQDFSAQKGSDAAMLLRSMAEKLARESGRRPVPFGKGSGPGRKH